MTADVHPQMTAMSPRFICPSPTPPTVVNDFLFHSDQNNHILCTRTKKLLA